MTTKMTAGGTAGGATVTVALSLRVGADLLAEPWTTLDLEKTWVEATRNGGVDGGLLIQHDQAAPACRPDLWDQLDGLLLVWLTALGELAGGANETIAQFPDTRIECELSRIRPDRVAVFYEDIATELPLQATQQALLAAAGRLLSAVNRATTSDALTALQQLVLKDI